MKVELLEETQLNSIRPKETERLKCIFYKNETCHPNRVNFKICLKCHRCQALSVERALPLLFNKIVGLAIFFMKTIGIGSSGGSGSGAGGAGGGK